MEIFHTIPFFGVLRIGHIFAAVMWMGLLWFFNFVQTPAYAEMEPPARNSAFDKLTWRGLWWFRWAAAATVLFGLLLLMVGSMSDSLNLYKGEYWMESASGPTLGIAIVMGVIMFLNVWLVIWPNQQVVIANARTLLAGGEANPDAAGAARAGAMASRQNTIFSITVLSFMVMAGHFWGFGDTQRVDVSSGKAILFYLIGFVIIAVLELNALGKISGRGNGGLNVIYETHKNAIYAGVGIFVFLYVLADILLRK
jgi:uncharacterized membrane protein